MYNRRVKIFCHNLTIGNVFIPLLIIRRKKNFYKVIETCLKKYDIFNLLTAATIKTCPPSYKATLFFVLSLSLISQY